MPLLNELLSMDNIKAGGRSRSGSPQISAAKDFCSVAIFVPWGSSKSWTVHVDLSQVCWVECFYFLKLLCSVTWPWVIVNVLCTPYQIVWQFFLFNKKRFFFVPKCNKCCEVLLILSILCFLVCNMSRYFVIQTTFYSSVWSTNVCSVNI